MLTYLFCTETRGSRCDEHVACYARAEMEELFTPHERLWLCEGKIVEREDRGCKLSYIDTFAARGRAPHVCA